MGNYCNYLWCFIYGKSKYIQKNNIVIDSYYLGIHNSIGFKNLFLIKISVCAFNSLLLEPGNIAKTGLSKSKFKISFAFALSTLTSIDSANGCPEDTGSVDHHDNQRLAGHHRRR